MTIMRNYFISRFQYSFTQTHQKFSRLNGGQAVILVVLFLLVISLTIVFSFAFVTVREDSITREVIRSKRSMAVSEAGVEDVGWRVKNLKKYDSSEVVVLSQGTTTVSTIQAGEATTISSRGESQAAYRKTEMWLARASGVSFFYGVQVGDLGLTMGNGSAINGNVYSNGDIEGFAASKNTITGTAVAATSHDIEKVRITQDAYGNDLEDCQVDGVAHYVSFISGCSAGATVQESVGQPAGTFPITQQQINDWKAEAEAGGTLSGYSIGNNSSESLGPKKVIGNLTIGNNSVLTLTGTVWVTGTITFGNSVIVQLDDAVYGSLSGVVVVDGAVTTGNTTILQGTGQSGSYLMLLSTYSGVGNAIDIWNSANSAIFYAPNDVVSIKNTLVVREVTARGLDVGNGVVVSYEAGLANALFLIGPSGSKKVKRWREIP